MSKDSYEFKMIKFYCELGVHETMLDLCHQLTPEDLVNFILEIEEWQEDIKFTEKLKDAISSRFYKRKDGMEF